MTTATHTKLQQIAKQAADHITKLNGEAETFEVVCGDCDCLRGRNSRGQGRLLDSSLFVDRIRENHGKGSI